MAEPLSILPESHLIRAVSGAAVNTPWESVQLQVLLGPNRKPCTSLTRFSIPACLQSVLLCGLFQPEMPFEVTSLTIYPPHLMRSPSICEEILIKNFFLNNLVKRCNSTVFEKAKASLLSGYESVIVYSLSQKFRVLTIK